MKNVPENELFSAYLDGELTAGEQAEVERLLATSPAARQLMDELRALSSTLQALPTHKLEEDLTPQVLRAAERRMLGQKADTQQPVPPFWKGLGRRLLAPRNLLFPAMAVAVAIALMVFEPGRHRPADDGREVARAPAERDERTEPTDAAMRAVDDRGEKAEQADPFDASGGEGERRMESKKLKARGGAKDAAASDPRPARAVKKEATVGAPTKTFAQKPGAPAAPPEGPKAESPSPETLAGKGGGMGGGHAQGPPPSVYGNTDNRGQGAEGIRDKAVPGFDATAGMNGPAQTVQAEMGTTAQDAVVADRRSGKLAIAPGTAIVFCDVSLQAARSGAFDRLLSRQKIVLDNDWEKRSDLAKKLYEKEVGGREDPGRASRSHGLAKQAKRKAGELDVVMVEATPAQVEATLLALNARPEDYVTVDVKPAPGRADQRGWAEYTRGPLTEELRRQLNGIFDAAQIEGKSASPDAGDRYNYQSDRKKREELEEQRQTTGPFQRVDLPGRDGGMPAVDEVAGPGQGGPPAKRPVRPKKPAPTQPPPQPAAPTTPPDEAPDDGRVPGDSPKPAPARKPPAEPTPEPPAEQAPEEPAAEAPVAAPKGAGIQKAPRSTPPPRPLPKTERKPKSDDNGRKLGEGGQAAADRPEPAVRQGIASPGEKSNEDGRRQDRDPASEQEDSTDADKDADKDAGTCRVLFVLRVVKPGDVAAAVAAQAARARAARINALEKTRPPAAAAEIDAHRAAPAESPPSAKK